MDGLSRRTPSLSHLRERQGLRGPRGPRVHLFHVKDESSEDLPPVTAYSEGLQRYVLASDGFALFCSLLRGAVASCSLRGDTRVGPQLPKSPREGTLPTFCVLRLPSHLILMSLLVSLFTDEMGSQRGDTPSPGSQSLEEGKLWSSALRPLAGSRGLCITTSQHRTASSSVLRT